NVEKADFVGSNLSLVNAFRDEDPEVPSTTKVLTKEDIKSLTFTNDILEEDDGDNGSKLFQQENYFDILFDGDKSGNMAEFKWYMDEDSFGPEVKLPTTFHIDLENEEDVQEINIYNRKSSNGRVTSIEAKAFSGDEEYDIGSYDEAKDVFKFELPTDAKDIDRIEITPKTSVGTTKFPDQENSNRMLSLHEIEIITQTGKPVSEI